MSKKKEPLLHWINFLFMIGVLVLAITTYHIFLEGIDTIDVIGLVASTIWFAWLWLFRKLVIYTGDN